jgi:hypothetical protein
MADIIEFYIDNSLLVSLKSSVSVQIGSLINIRKKTYEVVSVTLAVDNSEDFLNRSLRQNVDLKALEVNHGKQA